MELDITNHHFGRVAKVINLACRLTPHCRGRVVQASAVCSKLSLPLEIFHILSLLLPKYPGLNSAIAFHVITFPTQSTQKNHHPIHNQTSSPSTSSAMSEKFPALSSMLTK